MSHRTALPMVVLVLDENCKSDDAKLMHCNLDIKKTGVVSFSRIYELRHGDYRFRVVPMLGPQAFQFF